MMFSISPYSSSPYSALLDAFIEAGANISAISLVDASFQVGAQFNALIEALSQTSFGSTIQFYQVADTMSADSSISSDGSILVAVNSNLDISSQFSPEYLIYALGLSEFAANSSFSAVQYITALNSVALQVDSNLYAAINAINSNNSANFEVVALLAANLSQMNGDIVYYIVYTDKVKSFNLTIARTK